jgi:hypothetical protein
MKENLAVYFGYDDMYMDWIRLGTYDNITT